MRKRYSDSFKAEVVLELLKEEKTIAQIASDRQRSIPTNYMNGKRRR